LKRIQNFSVNRAPIIIKIARTHTHTHACNESIHGRKSERKNNKKTFSLLHAAAAAAKNVRRAKKTNRGGRRSAESR
jgi:hypothetical protein